MTSDPALIAEGLHKHYGRVPALQGVDIRLLRGQFCVLLGPNGAGKSTLMQLLTGLFNPDQGSVVVGGVAMAEQPSRALAQLGVVFQQSALDLDLSVQANLLFHTDLHGLPRREAMARTEALLPTLGLSDQRHTTVRALSGGNRRKVELVRALLHRPAVLLMDEATVGLDPASRQQLLQTVHQLCRAQNTAVLWATHLLEEVEGADALLLLQQGRLCYAGAVADFVAAQGAATFAEAAMQVLGSP